MRLENSRFYFAFARALKWFLTSSEEIQPSSSPDLLPSANSHIRRMLSDNTELSDEKINELVDTFMNTLPTMLKTQLQAA